MTSRYYLIPLIPVFFLSLSMAAYSFPFQEQEPETDWAALFPEDEGKELVVSLCSSCHGLQRLENQGKTEEQWRGTVDDMIGRGAQIFLDEADAIVVYLAKHLGPDSSFGSPQSAAAHSSQQSASPTLNLNTASAEELVEVLALERTLAREIVAYRDQHGPFKRVEDLNKVNGVEAKLMERIGAQFVIKEEP